MCKRERGKGQRWCHATRDSVRVQEKAMGGWLDLVQGFGGSMGTYVCPAPKVLDALTKRKMFSTFVKPKFG